MHPLGWLSLVLLAVAPAPGRLAPLPPSFTSEGDENNEGYRAPPPVGGIFAHGVAAPRWDADLDGKPCTGSAAEQARLLAAQPAGGREEFWFYATRSQGILLRRTMTIDSDKPCPARPTYDYAVDRAYVADGRIHALEVDSRNHMTSIGSAPVGRTAREFSGSFERIQSLMARSAADPRDRRERRSDEIAGTRVTCAGQSGLVWHRVCRVAAGSAKGMILLAEAGDDERVMFTTVIDRFDPDISLPGELFEIDRTWIGKD